MFFSWLHSYADVLAPLNVFRYITFRTFLSFLTAFLVCWLIGPRFIRRLKEKQVGQTIRDDGPQSHLKKQGTPTMGGGLILFSVLIPAVFWMDLESPLVLAALVMTLGFGGIGWVDDWAKVSRKTHRGLPGKLRLFLEFGLSSFVLFLLIRGGFSTELYFPFLKDFTLDLGWWYVAFGSLVIVGTANAVNLTDGLDGLAIAPIIIVSATLLVFAYLAGHWQIANYLQIPYIAGAGELAPLAAAVVAAGLGFLWYNSYPAQVFMGDIGSLSLGGFIGMTAVLTKNELVLVLLGGIFVIEAVSVITQVVSFKLTGRRVFRMAPIHHHFELTGIDEPKVIVRFWIVSVLLAVLSLTTLKLR